VACPTITAALDARFLSALLEQRLKLAQIIPGPTTGPAVDKQKLVDMLEKAVCWCLGWAVISPNASLINVGSSCDSCMPPRFAATRKE